MIMKTGNGQWEELLSMMRCPRCRTKMTWRGEDVSRKRYECPCCRMTVNDVKDEK
jgi:transposase-like protein